MSQKTKDDHDERIAAGDARPTLCDSGESLDIAPLLAIYILLLFHIFVSLSLCLVRNF